MGSCLSHNAVMSSSQQQQSKTAQSSSRTSSTDDSSHNKANAIISSNNQDSSLPNSHPSSIGLDELAKQRIQEGHLVSNVVNLESVRRIEDVYDGVHEGDELGEGVAGKVRLITHKATGVQYACKCLHLRRLHVEREQLRNEITIMAQLDHPNIARLQEVYEDESQIYLVQELGSGGELFDALDEQPDYHYDEAEAVRLVHQMLSALRYLHSKGIIHRDLKLENFLFSTTRHKQLKMIDFGLSKHFDSGDVHHEVVGTPYTVAPEVVNGNHDEKCDLWAIGVLTFMLLCGETPFGDAELPLAELKENILAGRYAFEPAPIWAKVSADAKDFVKTLLVTDPARRPSAIEAQQLTWIRSYHEASIRDATVDPEILQSLVAFKDLALSKRLMFEVVSFSLLPEQISRIRTEFEKFDSHGLGEISEACMNRVLGRGELSASEIHEIFESLKVGKLEPRVHFHEFIAACLKECNVDDRNLRIAFDRLDQDHSGSVTLQNVIHLIARDANENEEMLTKTWKESVAEYQCKKSSFSFDEFRRLMCTYL